MFTKNPEFKDNNYYWYREHGRLSVHLVTEQSYQTLAGPVTEFVANNGRYLVPVASMVGEWWHEPIPVPSDAE